MRVVEYISIHGAKLDKNVGNPANTFIAKDVQTNLIRNIRVIIIV